MILVNIISYTCMILLLLYLPFGATQFEKRWTKTNSWEDPSNWRPSGLPCSGDTILFESNDMYIDQNVTLEEGLNLPVNGEITLGLNMNIVFGKTERRKKRSPSQCDSGKKEERTFIGQQHKNWLNPNNWDIYKNDRKDEYLTKAVPSIDRVPCRYDRVSFPQKGTFEVYIEHKELVKEIVVNGAVINQNEELKSYLSSKNGKSSFDVQIWGASSGSLKLATTPCTKTSCSCNNAERVNEICTTFECPVLTCTSTTQPVGDCCPRCGAIMNVEPLDMFDMNECSEELRRYLAKDRGYAEVRVHISWVRTIEEEGHTQILLSEDTGGEAAKAAAEAITTYIDSGSSKSCSVTLPEKLVQPPTSSETIALSVLLPIIIIAILIIIGVLVYKYKIPSIKKERFKNNDITTYPGFDDIEMTGRGGNSSTGDIAFANPVYDLSELDGAVAIASDTTVAFRNNNNAPVEVISSGDLYETLPEVIVPDDSGHGYATLEVPDAIPVFHPGSTSGIENPMFNVEGGGDTDYAEVLHSISGETPETFNELEGADGIDPVIKLEVDLNDLSGVEELHLDDTGDPKLVDVDDVVGKKGWVTDFEE